MSTTFFALKKFLFEKIFLGKMIDKEAKVFYNL